MAVTEALQKQLESMARKANQRLERASEGQRGALQHYMRKYHTRNREGLGLVFQTGKAKTDAEAKSRIRELEAFLASKTSTRSGWEQLKKESIEKAGETIRGQGSDITDEELAQILTEIGEGHSSSEFYKALANVEIAKRESPDWAPSADKIAEAINARRSAQERTQLLIEKRQKRS